MMHDCSPVPVCRAALLGYEYLVHLPQEVELFWKRKITGASVLFFANRYLSLLAQMMQFIDPTSARVRRVHRIPDIHLTESFVEVP